MSEIVAWLFVAVAVPVIMVCVWKMGGVKVVHRLVMETLLARLNAFERRLRSYTGETPRRVPLTGEAQSPVDHALSPRPEWRVRLLVDGLPALACFRVPAGYARTPAEAVAAVRVLRPRAVKRLPAGRWVAFPVVDEEPVMASGAEGRA